VSSFSLIEKLDVKKDTLVHVAPACAESQEDSDHHDGSYVRIIFMHFCKRLFPGLEPPHGHKATTLPLNIKTTIYNSQMVEISICFMHVNNQAYCRGQ
jgi:hypothetical protein